jgi:hypothetical protein
VFANGNVRLAAIDTVEPANGAAYLLLLSPPLNQSTGAMTTNMALGRE